MKRNFMLMCVSALVLALGLSSSAVASVEVGAKPAAKKGTKKGKACKKGKAGKAGKSTVALAKKKGKGCKKGKAKGKGAPAAGLSDGTYRDPASLLELKVTAGTVSLSYVPPGFCVSFTYTSDPAPLTRNGSTWMASEDKAFSFVGDPATVKWDISIKEPGLEYALNFKLESNTMIGLCKGEGHPKGTLTKVS